MTGPSQHVQDIIAAVGTAETLAERWTKLSGLLCHIGIDQINYGLFVSPERATTDVRFLSTMDPGWIEYYGDRRLDLDDPHVSFVRNNNMTPYVWGEHITSRLEPGKVRDAARMAAEAGLRSQWQVTLPDMNGSLEPIGGMAIGSSLPHEDFLGVLKGNEAALVTIAHLFHAFSLGEARRLHAGIPSLSPRERDCLSFVAEGHRIDRIAEKMRIAKVTVELHLRGARRKLNARTLAQAVAKGLYYREIRCS